MPRVLALDIATRTGFAHDGPDPGRPICGIFDLPRPLGSRKTGFERGITLARFKDHLLDRIAVSQCELGVIEAPLNVLNILLSKRGPDPKFKTSFDTILLLIELVGLAEEVFYRQRIELAQTENQKFKRWFTGVTGGGKDPVKARCKQLGWDIAGDDNAADACGIWAYAKALRDPKWTPNATIILGRKV